MTSTGFTTHYSTQPVAVLQFLELLNAHPNFECRPGKVQIQIFHQGRKLGGLDTKNGHWYLSKLFVEENGGPSVAETHGFTRREKHQSGQAPHVYWARESGSGSISDVLSVLHEMTGKP